MNKGPRVQLEQSPDHQDSHTLWFNAPLAQGNRRPPLTRERVAAEALTIIAEDGVAALTMRTLAARLQVVPGALYRHVRNKEQLHDLVLDGVLAEVDCRLDRSLPWTEQLTVMAHRLRAVLEAHPGIAGLLQLRDPLGPHSLAVAEAFLAPLRTARFADHQAGLAGQFWVRFTGKTRSHDQGPNPSSLAAHVDGGCELGRGGPGRQDRAIPGGIDTTNAT
jgi:AcrR family transcriptional regulator